MSYGVRLEYSGIDPMKIEAVAGRVDDIMLNHMERGVETSMQIIEGEWKRLAPVRTGEYRAHVQHTTTRTGNNVVGSVFNLLPKAEFIERGTGIYRHGGGSRGYIRPRSGKAMRWRGGDGSYVFARAVRGMRPRWVARQARINTRHLVTVNMAVAAANAAREIKAAL